MSILNRFPLSPYTFILLRKERVNCFRVARPKKNLSKGPIFEEVRAQSHGILEIAIFCNRPFVSEALSSTMFSYSSSLI